MDLLHHEFPDKVLSFPSSGHISTVDDHGGRNGCDMSDAALRYIDQILMEEDTDDGAHMLEESSHFQETERSFYEVLGKKYPPSPQQESSQLYADHHYSSTSGTPIDVVRESRFKTPTGPFDSLTDHIVPSDSSISPSSGLYCVVQHKRSIGGSEGVWDFKEGATRVSNFVPRQGKMLHIIRVTIQNPPEGENKAVKPSEDRARTTKNPPGFTESDIPIEEFDKLLLSTLDDRVSKDVKNPRSSVSKARLVKSHKVKREAIDWSTLLSKCAEMVASDYRQAATSLLTEIRQHSSPNGDWAERLAHYFADGLEARLAGTGSQMYKSLVISPPACLKTYYTSIASFPCLKVTNLVLNKLLTARSAGSARVHIIDFGIIHGFHWPIFIRRLALRPGGPPRLRITGVDFPRSGPGPTKMMEETGERLARYAQAFGVPFEFSGIVAQEWESVSTADFRVEPGEFLAVTCSHRGKNLQDESKTAVLKLIRGIGPDVFVHDVVDGAYSAGSLLFPTRFREAFFQFSALFDMVESTSMLDGKPGRMLFEGIFRKDIMNVVACEGPDRVERPENRRQWHVRHVQAGLRQVSFGRELTVWVTRKVKGSYHRDFVVEEENKWLLMSWKGRVLSSLSCWEPAEVSHHPPMSAAHAENEHFVYDITSKYRTRLSTLKNSSVVLDLVPPPSKAHNIIFGRRTWVDSPGDVILTNLTTGDKGKYLSSIFFGYLFSRLEERQRAEKRTRETNCDEFKPKWFDLTSELASTPWGDLEIYNFNGKYAQHCASVDHSSDGESEIDNSSLVFNP
ncbi:Scarecrow-like protein 9 [Striga hermonthica]|uniref:Scarecrow-like protein 9 n=1 Tax=Striga hermonthica TaxID=68872 RepID=A0A9N7NUE0_STRHE|nr:Scarecrow-like protein 9 [Striga hermonthica]